jgi:hypothetical protein
MSQKSNADNVYLNISVTNTNPDINSSVQAVYNVTYDQPILQDPSQYYAAITSFQIPLGELPLFVMPFIHPDIYEAYGTQVGNTITGVQTFFTPAMVGGPILIAGISGTVTGYVSQTVITVSFAATIINPTIFTITYGNLNPNKTPYVVGCCLQQNGNVPPATPPNGTPNPSAANFPVNVTYWTEIFDLTNNPTNPLYYYVYDYNHYVDMLNYSLQQSWINAGSPGGGDNWPYFIYDSDDGLIKCVMPILFTTQNGGAPPGYHWTVFFNYQCFYNTLSFYTVENNGRVEIWNWPAIAYDDSQIAPVPIGTGLRTGATAAYLISEEYPSIDYLNSIRKIVITTNSIPIQKEYYPNPGGLNLSTANSIPILSSYSLDLLAPGQQRSVAIFTASGPYKLIDLNSDAPLRKIDITFWWVDRLNNFYPIYIDPFDAISLTIGFFSKKLYRNQQLKNV